MDPLAAPELHHFNLGACDPCTVGHAQRGREMGALGCFCHARRPWQQPLGWVMKGLHGSWTWVEFNQLSPASRGAVTSQ